VETAVTFPGLPAIVPSVRKFVRGILADSPCAEDMELIAAELASNAIRHSPQARTAASSPSPSAPARDGHASRSPTPAPGNGTRRKVKTWTPSTAGAWRSSPH